MGEQKNLDEVIGYLEGISKEPLVETLRATKAEIFLRQRGYSGLRWCGH